ncbi:hypothetical protein ACFL1X_02670 [Candidatus Hydrogenedentota bacterium]
MDILSAYIMGPFVTFGLSTMSSLLREATWGIPLVGAAFGGLAELFLGISSLFTELDYAILRVFDSFGVVDALGLATWR